MKKSICIIFTFLLSSILFSQQPKYDKAIESLIDSAYDKFNRLELASSIKFADKALKESKKKSYASGISWSSFYIGQNLFELVKYKEALEYLDIAENNSYVDSDPFLKFEIHRVRSRIYGSMQLFEKSVKEQFIGIQYVQKTDKTVEEKKYLMSLAYENLANTYNIAKKSDSSFIYLQKNLVLLETMDSGFVYANLVNLYTELGNYYALKNKRDKALEYFKKSEKVARKYQFNYLSNNLMKWGDLEVGSGNYDEALILYKRALKNLEESRHEHSFPDIYTRIANIYETKGNKEEAKEFNLKSLELQNKIRIERISTSEHVMNKILKDNNSEVKQKYTKQLFLYFILFGLISLTGIYLFRRNVIKIRKLKTQSKEQINELEKKLNESYEEILQMAKTNDPQFWSRFQEVYPKFRENLLNTNDKLTKAELKLAAYIYLGFTTAEIAELTFRTFKTIESTRYNLRKKLGLTSEINLQLWLENLL